MSDVRGESDKYAETMHDYVLLGMPLEPLPPLRTESTFRWQHLAVIAALVFVLGVVIYNVAVTS